MRKFIISLTSLALAAGMLVGAPAPVRAVAPENDDFADRAEIVSSTTIDIMSLEDATDQDLDALDICGLDPTNLWDPEGTECHEDSGEDDYYNSLWWVRETTPENAYRVTLEVPLCIAEVTGDYVDDNEDGEPDYLYPYGSDIGLAVYGGPQGDGTTYLDLASEEYFNWSYEGLVIALEVRATDDEMPILIGLYNASSAEDWIDYEACGDDEDSLTLTVTDITSTAPENDLVESASALDLGDSIDIDLTNATSSYSDPTHYEDWPDAEHPVRSAWYTWTAPATETYAFDTVGSDCIILSEEAYFYEKCGDTVLAVFSGNPEEGLTEIDTNDDCSAYDNTDDLSTRIYEDYLSCLELDATEGTQYYFMVGSYSHYSEYVDIHVGFEEATIPVNTVAPRLLNSNVLRAGRTVSVNNGVWSGGTLSYEYAWYVCKRRVAQRASAVVMGRICTEITGADTASFTPTRAQARQWRNRHLLAQVTASNGEGEADALTGTSHATMR